jgi:hypothetical protein
MDYTGTRPCRRDYSRLTPKGLSIHGRAGDIATFEELLVRDVKTLPQRTAGESRLSCEVAPELSKADWSNNTSGFRTRSLRQQHFHEPMLSGDRCLTDVSRRLSFTSFSCFRMESAAGS